jgi:mRNA interferase MazF
VICAPVYTSYDGLSTQVPVGIDEGLKHDSAIHCDELISIPKSLLIHFIGKLSLKKLELLEQALKAALQINGAYDIDG